MTQDDWEAVPGALVLAQLGPVRGSEQDGLRPVLVLSVDQIRAVSRVSIVCPITRNTQPWPTKVFLPAGLAVEGAVLCDQIRAIDRRERFVRQLGSAPAEVVGEVKAKVAALLAIEVD